jgi:pimeloyl-ACP methyl ester carboxylesterase
VTSVYKSAAARRLIQDWCRNRVDNWDVAHRRWDAVTTAGLTSVVAAGPDRVAAPTVVVVPGTNMNAAVSLAFVEKLARRWPTIILDVPGQPGLSADRRPRRNRMAWYGQWLSEALENTTTEPAVVVGHSLGGAIALACPSPRIVGRVLISPAGLVRLAVGPSILATTIPWLARPTTARTNRLLRHMLAPGHEVDEQLSVWMTLVARHCRSSLAPMPLSGPTLAAASGGAPCLVAVGRGDVFLPPDRLGPAVRRRLESDLRSLADCGHLGLDEQPDEIVALVAEVVTRSGSGPGHGRLAR